MGNRAATAFLNQNPRGVEVSDGGKKAEVSKIFEWYAGDFQAAGGVIAFINKYRKPPLPIDAQLSYRITTGASMPPTDFTSPAALPAVAADTRSARPPRPGKWRARWQAFRHPIAGEKTELLRARWASLPAELRTPNQSSGRHLTHCGFTTGASDCSFRCTHCCLPKSANQVPMPSLAQPKEQIDANRRFQGPGAGLQFTGGDVAGAHWRSGRQNELAEIVRYAIRTGLVPMLMTHGQTLIEHPEFLEMLMVEGGLRQVAVHIDMTQAGRHGYPINRIFVGSNPGKPSAAAALVRCLVISLFSYGERSTRRLAGSLTSR